jgi:hypothetical protein
MKVIIAFALLLIGIPLMIAALFAITGSPTVYQSEAALLVSNSTVNFVGTSDQNGLAGKNGDRLDVFVITNLEPAGLLEVGRENEKAIAEPSKYFAYFFDDKEFAKAPYDFSAGFPADDEQTLTHLKAVYEQGKLTLWTPNGTGKAVSYP